MSNIIPFNFNNHDVRVVEDDAGELWFVLVDVCNVLGLSNPSRVAQRLDDDERSNLELGRQGNGTIINESGLYSVILRSDKPGAKPFKKWVTSEVLPTIRKTGRYELENVDITKNLEANRVFRSNIGIAKLLFDGNQAVLSANKVTLHDTGVDVMGRFGATHLLADSQSQLLTVTDIAKHFGSTARKMNTFMIWCDLQSDHRDSGDRLYYELSDLGKQYGQYLDTSKKHSDGTPIRQIKWNSDVIDYIAKQRKAVSSD